jgi:cyclopropane-fatty-acyl-phospholipid synthase
MSIGIELMERGWLPDALIRIGIRRLLARRQEEISDAGATVREQAFIDDLRKSPVAILTDKANEQHYEVPADFFHTILGPRLKYSSCLWPDGVDTLAGAEERMLALTCERAGIENGMEILELGCGWGSLTLWMAEKYPDSRITAVSNSHSQRTFIEARAERAGLKNVRIITADMNDFATTDTFDRVVSVEMFEHMRNYERLLHRIAGWLKPEGKLFIHIFCHRDHVYPFETEGEDDWMGRYFFTGGLMPSKRLMDEFNKDLKVEAQWRVNGVHYARTLRAWLDLMDAKKNVVLPMLKKVYGKGEGARWFERWRVFFMACEELFAYHDGEEWFVTHILMGRAGAG